MLHRFSSLQSLMPNKKLVTHFVANVAYYYSVLSRKSFLSMCVPYYILSSTLWVYMRR